MKTETVTAQREEVRTIYSHAAALASCPVVLAVAQTLADLIASGHSCDAQAFVDAWEAHELPEWQPSVLEETYTGRRLELALFNTACVSNAVLVAQLGLKGTDWSCEDV